jgi:hypothetical protein
MKSTNTKNLLTNFKKQFSKFGLNPNKWKLKALNKRNSKSADLLYYHVEEPSLELYAQASLTQRSFIHHMQII